MLLTNCFSLPTIWQCSGKSWEMLGLKLQLNPVRSINLCHAVAIYINLCMCVCVCVCVCVFIYRVLFHHQVVPSSLQPHELQYTRLPHPSPTLWKGHQLFGERSFRFRKHFPIFRKMVKQPLQKKKKNRKKSHH